MDLSRAIPVVHTSEPAATRAFYEGVLGMEVRMDRDGFLLLASRSHRAVQVIVAWASPTAWDPLVLDIDLSIDVEGVPGVDAAHAAVRAAGLEVTYPPTVETFGRYRFVVREPSGARVNVACHA